MRVRKKRILKSVKRFLDQMRIEKSQNIGACAKSIGKSGQLF
ncbi:hypothetical protein CES85_2602 [Ochrobactrum quorumnocens]|uniref:Uncharacterized protein n=1 Tax=Ochrobactrum quorumnocens TaxID=271865 RepID=A0A248UGP1_9HYPH|nr:hypothetical protein CES85_2602 [[Ochrobactrum] quorumnocens]